MADFFLHCQMIEDLYKKYPTYQHIDYAKIGTQGPDPYFNVLKKAYKEGNHLGNKLHHYHINQSLITMTKYVKANYSDELMAYYRGYLAHFALDTHIHPYIFYLTGEYDKTRVETHHYFGYHMRFERSIDVAYIQKRYQKKASKFHNYKHVFPLKDVPKSIKDLMSHVTKEVFDVDQGGMYFENGYHTMRLLSKVLIKDRLGIKKQFLKGVGLFLKLSMLYVYDYPYTTKPDAYDFLNDKHNTWHHPVTNKSYDLSVEQIYEQAFKRLEQLIKETDAYILEHKDVDLKSLFGNQSYDTGLDIDTQGPMQYFDLYIK